MRKTTQVASRWYWADCESCDNVMYASSAGCSSEEFDQTLRLLGWQRVNRRRTCPACVRRMLELRRAG